MSRTLEVQELLNESGLASADLAEYTCVVKSGDNLSVAGDGADALGVVVRKFGTGERAMVVTDGIVPVKCATAGTLAIGDPVACAANGQIDAGTTGNPVIGYLKTAPAADGDIVQVRISQLISATIA